MPTSSEPSRRCQSKKAVARAIGATIGHLNGARAAGPKIRVSQYLKIVYISGDGLSKTGSRSYSKQT